MTGGTVVRGKGGAHYQRYAVEDTTWPPRFLRLELHFQDGTQWAFCDSRRFARIRLVRNPLQSAPLKDLGWDPLLSWPSLSEFSEALLKQRRTIKALLLDQSFSAGVGNWVADEVLFQSRIHPEQPANSLTQEQVKELHKHVQEVCRLASAVNADSTLMPDSWLFHHRWGKGAAVKAKIKGHTIDHITVGGRTSAYVPALQKLVKKHKISTQVAVKKVAVGVVAAAPPKLRKKEAPIKTKTVAKTRTRQPLASTATSASSRRAPPGAVKKTL
jgi:formamidopyrimidine-DNA glycosylase